MKNPFKNNFIRVAAIALLLILVSPSTASAGWGKRIADKVAELVDYLESNDETIASIMMDQLSTSSNTRTYTRKLYSGNEYTAVAVGDSRINDTDLVVYRKSGGSWIQVKKDADSQNTAVVTFDCDYTGEYKFEIKAYSFKSDYTNAYFGFILSF